VLLASLILLHKKLLRSGAAELGVRLQEGHPLDNKPREPSEIISKIVEAHAGLWQSYKALIDEKKALESAVLDHEQELRQLASGYRDAPDAHNVIYGVTDLIDDVRGRMSTWDIEREMSRISMKVGRMLSSIDKIRFDN